MSSILTKAKPGGAAPVSAQRQTKDLLSPCQLPRSVEIRTREPGKPDYGTRLVATRPFHRGDVIFSILGCKTQQSYKSVQIGWATHVEDTRLLAYQNHSCRPNTIVDTAERKVLALRDIPAGDELTFFYPSTEWTMVQPFRCLCGSSDCLGQIAGAKYLSLDTLSRYFINDHIRQIAAAVLSTTPLGSLIA